jgi:hypothetical protein
LPGRPVPASVIRLFGIHDSPFVLRSNRHPAILLQSFAFDCANLWRAQAARMHLILRYQALRGVHAC